MQMKVVAVCSGGVDSIAYLVNATSRASSIHVLTFDYGQKGIKEINVLEDVLKTLKSKHSYPIDEVRKVPIQFMKELWPKTQLTDNTVNVAPTYEQNVVVPVRNAVFLSIATAYAYSISAGCVIYGSHLNDSVLVDYEPLYPDCSPEFILAFEHAMRLGHFRRNRGLEIWSAARSHLTKSRNIQEAFGRVGDLLFKTWSCYQALEKHCGNCESCANRHNAFIEALGKDETEYMKPYEVN